ncbi:MAG TPA: glycosyltransferase family 1 protein, partial [Thermoanaerobaculia bacterium]|nr:glycosyltransferase family 1 protein [Thermoanaerobaculia bacterium]
RVRRDAVMKIGISAVYFASGGSLTNLVQLLREWRLSGALDAHRVVLFASPAAVDALRARLDGETLRGIGIELLGSRGRGLLARLLAEQILLPRRLREHAIDVVFCPANVIPYFTPVPSVVTFQNAAPFCESVTLRSLRHLGWWLRFRLLGLLIRASARRAARVIFISAWFRERLASRIGFPRERGEVIPRARLDVRAASPMSPASPPVLLYVSHLNPYKNVLEVIDAFAAANVPEWRLVLAGRTNFPWYRRAIVARIVRHRLQDRVTLAGEVDGAAVETLLAGASAFVFASTCENCPTALIEALSYGLPVACSKAGVMPEVAGDAVAYFDPRDAGSLRAALHRMMTDAAFRAELARRARARALEFPDARDVAARTLAAIERAAGARA